MAIIEQNDELTIHRLSLGPYGTNTYILVCNVTTQSVVVDAPGEAEEVMAALSGTIPQYILITHNHMDHTGALVQLKKSLNVPVAAHISDSQGLPLSPDLNLKQGDVVAFGKIRLEVLQTPGHTPGSLCFYRAPYLISGDTLFPGGPGKTWSPAAFMQIVSSLTQKIFTLPDDTKVYPGHGDGTTVGKAKKEFGLFSAKPHDPDLCGDVTWQAS